VEIVHLETGRHLYGGARQAGYLIESLAAQGLHNVVVCASGSGLARALPERDRIERVEWPLSGDLDWRLYRRLRELLAHRRPALLHVHSRRGADSIGGRAARAAGCPAVLTRRVQSAEPGVWLRFKCRPYAAIVAISTAVATELKQAGIRPERLRLIPSAVDTRLFAPDPDAGQRLRTRFGLPADALVAGVAAQFIPRKGHDLLLPLADRLARGEPRLRLVLFGQGPERARLERRARRLGLEATVRFAGFVDDWPALLPGLDLLLHPARREGLGAVVLEAMSAGVPVIAARVGGLCDVIEHGTDGWLVAPDQLDDWAVATARWLDDPVGRAALAAAGRRKVDAAYTIGTMTQRYLELYRDVAR